MAVDKVYIRDVRKANLCMSGSRKWFRDRNWSWPTFLESGWSAQAFLDTGCPLAARVVQAAQEESDGIR